MPIEIHEILTLQTISTNVPVVSALNNMIQLESMTIDSTIITESSTVLEKVTVIQPEPPNMDMIQSESMMTCSTIIPESSTIPQEASMIQPESYSSNMIRSESRTIQQEAPMIQPEQPNR